MAFYILVYVGVEVTIGGESTYKYKVQCLVLKGAIGWIVTYLIHERGGGSSSGYVSSGFFGGWSHQKHNRMMVLSVTYRVDSGSSRASLGEPQSRREKGCVRLRSPGHWVGL